MPVDVRLRIVTRQLEKFARDYPKAAFSEMRKAFQIIVRDFDTFFTKHRLSGRTGDQGLNVRSGTLRRAFKHSVTGTNFKSLQGTMGFMDPISARIAGLHEEGGEVRPKQSQFLAIPLKGALTRSGKSRGSAGEFRAEGGTFIKKGPQGQPIIYQRRESGKIRALFVLVKSARIPARLELRRTWASNATVRSMRLKTMQDALNRALKRTTRGGRG